MIDDTQKVLKCPCGKNAFLSSYYTNKIAALVNKSLCLDRQQELWYGDLKEWVSAKTK